MKQVIIFREDLKLGKGKLAAHAAHAAIVGYTLVEKKDKKLLNQWLVEGEKKIVLKIKDEASLIGLYEKIKNKVPCQIIRDAGLTQVEPGTITCLVIGPWYEEEIDPFISDLKLL
jgi:PTH2 family peptidyl-tRNA hydrolase